MSSKRNLYRTLAMESVANARQFYADARRLKRVGSRGHAIAFAVLSIEESSKALIYRQVAEGVLRLVRKNPNHVTTFTEGELLDHRFKHGVLANALAEVFRYGPFYETIEGLRKQTFTKDEVKELVLTAVHSHRVLQVDLASGGRAAQDAQRLGTLLESLNDLKNRGLYVDHSKARISSPKDIGTRDLRQVLEMAEGAIEISTEALHANYTEREKHFQKEANRALVASIRRAQKRTKRPGRGGPA